MNKNEITFYWLYTRKTNILKRVKSTLKHSKYNTRKVCIFGIVIAFTVLCFTASFISTARAVTLQALNEDQAPAINGIRENEWEGFNSEPFTGFATDKAIKLYSFYYIDTNESVTYIYFGILLIGTENKNNESFAFFLSNYNSSNTSVSSIYDYDDLKIIRFDGVTYDMYPAYDVDNDEYYFRNDSVSEGSGNNVEAQARNNTDGDENKAFYEMRFPISTDHDDDVNWSVNNEYAILIYHGNSYENESGDYNPIFDNWVQISKISLQIGVLETGEPEQGIFNEEKMRDYLDKNGAKIALFSIAASLFGIISIHSLIKARNKIKREL
ncbi:MAG: hypothetical protein ACTSRA_15870 [Promethearchaeota archaeon]